MTSDISQSDCHALKRMVRWWICLCFIYVASPLQAKVTRATAPANIILLFGNNVSTDVQGRILRLMGKVRQEIIIPSVTGMKDFSSTKDLEGFLNKQSTGRAKHLVLAFGNHPVTEWVLRDIDLPSQGPEAIVIRRMPWSKGLILAANGNPVSPTYLPFQQVKLKGHLGAHYAAYAALEALGFGFLHPLQPIIPKVIGMPSSNPQTLITRPHWPRRAVHLHTMHPTELTDVLNGWGPRGPLDSEGWSEQVQHWINYVDWLLGNRQNHVHWVLLEKDSWSAFSTSKDRQDRLAKLVRIAQDAGIFVGIDAPIALEQQNGFRLIRDPGSRAKDKEQLHARIDWLMQAGFNYISTEMGFSEFTSPKGQRMIDWLNDFSDYLKRKWKAHGETKAHVSMGQRTPGFKDPVTGAEESNFNFLTYFADQDLSVLVHTVQHYSLDDPAPTYGRQNFKEMFQYLKAEAGRRPVLWFPETAYWVSFDIDVPLFLPLYAERRLYDLRLIARAQVAKEINPIQGQAIFSSGWEWGYWLNDVIAARAAWDPRLDIAEDASAFQTLLESALAPIGSRASALAARVASLAKAQRDLLILGKVKNWTPYKGFEKLTGQGYLQGWEPWDELPRLLRKWPWITNISTQPDYKSLAEVRESPLADPNYPNEVKPLLQAMEDEFAALSENWRQEKPKHLHPIETEFADGLRLTYLRARQVHGLYDYVFSRSEQKSRLQDARSALDEAFEIVKAREKAYRVQPKMISGWREGPTSYRFGYLWPVKTLYYWYRDEGLAIGQAENFCYLNIIDPAIIVSPKGRDDWRFQLLRGLTKIKPLFGFLQECVNPPVDEPQVQRRVRPQAS